MSIYVINDVVFVNNNQIGIGTIPRCALDLGIRQDGISIPEGTTEQRPILPILGALRFNITLGFYEVYTNNWTTIQTTYNILTSLTPNILPNIGDTTIVTGINFVSDMSFQFRGRNGRLYTISTWILDSSTQATITRPQNLLSNNQPYSLIAILPNSISFSLDDVINISN